MTCSICTAPCAQPEVAGRPALCTDCDAIVRKQVQSVLVNRERQRRWRVRQRIQQRISSGQTRVLHHAGRDGLEDWQEALPKSKEVDPKSLPPPPTPRLHNGSEPRRGKKKAKPDVRYCVRCEERPLNLGRYKTQGDTCGTCKRELRTEEREKKRQEQPEYAVDQADLERQLNDQTPLPDDDDEEAWARLLNSEDKAHA